MASQPWYERRNYRKFFEGQLHHQPHRLQNQLSQDVAILHTVMFKITSAVALTGMVITTVIAYF